MLKWHTLLEHTAQGIQVKIIPPTLCKYFPTLLLIVESVNNMTHLQETLPIPVTPHYLHIASFFWPPIQGALSINNTDTLAGDPTSF